MKLKYRLKFEIQYSNKSSFRDEVIDTIVADKVYAKHSILESDYPIREPKDGEKIILDGVSYFINKKGHEYLIEDDFAIDELTIEVISYDSKRDLEIAKMRAISNLNSQIV